MVGIDPLTSLPCRPTARSPISLDIRNLSQIIYDSSWPKSRMFVPVNYITLLLAFENNEKWWGKCGCWRDLKRWVIAGGGICTCGQSSGVSGLTRSKGNSQMNKLKDDIYIPPRGPYRILVLLPTNHFSREDGRANRKWWD